MPVSWFAEVERLVPQKPAGQTQERLEALVTRLHQLTRLRATHSNQRRLLTEAAVLASIDAVIALVTRQIRGLEIELIASDPLWRKLDETFRSIKGVADRTVARLMAELPEIGTLSNKPSPNSPASPPSPATAARSAANAPSAPDEAVSARNSAVAQKVAAKEASFADFLEAILRAERDARRARAREMFARSPASRPSRRSTVSTSAS